MKNLHFCKYILLVVNEAQDGNVFSTYRTGFVPGVYTDEIVNLNERIGKKENKFLCKGKIQYVLPLQYKEFEKYSFHSEGLKELKESYKGRKFHPDQWFFEISIKVIKN